LFFKNMGFFIYIVFSEEVDRYYVGQTDNLDIRLDSHNSGKSPYTSIAKDWKMVYA